MRFYIPSYQRPQRQKTLRYLADLGYVKDEIVIATQTPGDYEAYAQQYASLATIVYASADSIAKNRNTLMNLMQPGEHAVMLDDDITRFDVLVPLCTKKHPYGYFRPVTARAELEMIISGAFKACEQKKALTWGMYSIHNERMMYGALQRHRISYDRLFAGTIIGLIKTDQLFDTQYDTKEDYEYLLRQARAGRPILRLNWVSPYAEHFTSGGCTEARQREDAFSAALLASEYPEYVKQNKRKRMEIQQTNPLWVKAREPHEVPDSELPSP